MVCSSKMDDTGSEAGSASSVIPLPIYSHPHNPLSPLKKQAEVPISSFLLTAMRQRGGLSCVMSSGSTDLP